MESVKNVVLVLGRPQQVFEKLKERTGLIWLVAVILLVSASLFKSILTIPAVQKEAVESAKQMKKQVKAEAEKGKRSKDAPPPIPKEALRQMEQELPVGLLISGMVIATIMMVIGLVISAGIILLLVMMLGGSLNFTKSLSLMALSFMPFFARDILQTLYTLATGKLASSMGLASLVMPKTSPFAAVVPAKPETMPSQYLISVLSRIDLFVIWHLVILFFGLMILAGLSRRKSALLSAGYWVITLVPVLLSTFVTSLFIPTGPM